MTARVGEPPADLDIVGRSLELAAVDRFLQLVAAGGAGVVGLLLEGEPGLGKSMLWKAAIGGASAASLDVLQSAPAAVEQGLSFVALRDLLGGLTDEDLARLPPPQRAALEVALLRAPAEETGDQGALGAAVTAVLRHRASVRPTLVAIDDVHWLDQASARTLGFALRRLGDARVGLLLTRRTGEDAPFMNELAGDLEGRLERLRLQAISFGALHRLLAVRTGHRFARPLVARIERASGGNPMAALEIARALLDSGMQSSDSASDLPVPERLHDLLHARLARVSAAARGTLLLVAALARPTTAVLARAARDAAVTEPALAEAEAAGIVSLDDGRVEFSHPLFAAVVLAAATSSERRDAHQRLAAVVTDHEERAHHLAMAATGPDAALAAQLEAAGLETYRRGAPDAGARLLARAQALTPASDVEGRGRRAIHEAEARLEAGDLRGAADVLEDALAWLQIGRQRSEALLLLGTIRGYLDRPRAVATLQEALPGAAADPTLLGRIHGRIALFEDDVEASRAHGRAAVRLIDAAIDPSALAFATFGLFLNDAHAGAPPDFRAFESALALEPDVPTWEVSTIPALWWAYTGEHDLARARLERHLRWARDSGDASSDADLYGHLAELEVYARRWQAADVAADRSVDAAEQMGQLPPDPSHRVRALVDANLGRLDRAITATEAGSTACHGVDPELEAMYLDVLGSARLAAADHAGAVDAFERMRELLDRLGMLEPLRHRTEPDHIEALIGTGATARASEVLASLERRQEVLARPWIAADLPRSKALVQAAQGDVAGAADALATAVDAATPMGGDQYALARSLLVLGRIERQLGRRRSAGERLDRAASLFDELPATAWAALARRETDRLGRRRGAGEALTPAESRVVELIAAGATNRAAAEQLFLSPKTVEAHLARAYAKLGIRSRAELGRRLAGSSPPTTSETD